MHKLSWVSLPDDAIITLTFRGQCLTLTILQEFPQFAGSLVATTPASSWCGYPTWISCQIKTFQQHRVSDSTASHLNNSFFSCPSFFLPRYQYYLQVKKVSCLDGRLHCTVEQGIRLAGLAVQGKTLTHTHTHTCMNKHLMWIIYQRGDRRHKRERVSTNSHFLRSSRLHYLIWLHTTGRA